MNNEQKDYLIHYASPYYDPVKAHEYYMRTRELKGKRSTSELNSEGKEVWGYTKNQISIEKRSKTTALTEERKQKTEKLRQEAAETQARITEKLRKLNEKLAKKMQDIRDDKPPSYYSTGAKNRVRREKSEKLAELAGEKATNRSNANDERARVRTELKAALEATRNAYISAKQGVDSDYETIFQQEFDKIKAEYPKLAKSQNSKSSGTARTVSGTDKKKPAGSKWLNTYNAAKNKQQEG